MTLQRVMAATIAALLPAIALAQATTYATTRLRAGPGTTYPALMTLPPGVNVNVKGCVADYSWCDMYTPDERYRGWAAGTDLAVTREGSFVSIAQAGAASGIPVIGFTQSEYWGTFYRNLPFFKDWLNSNMPSR